MLVALGLYFALAAFAPGPSPGADADARATPDARHTALAAPSSGPTTPGAIAAPAVDPPREGVVELTSGYGAPGGRAERRSPRATGSAIDALLRVLARGARPEANAAAGSRARLGAEHLDRRTRPCRPGGRIPRMDDGDPPRA